MKREQSTEFRFGEPSDEWLKFNSSLLAVAHELKSPLCLIRQLSLFLEEQTSAEQVMFKKYLQQISSTSERGLRLANDLVKIGRLDQLELSLEPLSPVEVCRQVANELAPYYQLHRRRLVVRTKQRRNYLIMANFDLLRSVLINFCDNALYYAKPGQPIEINISKQRQAARVRISVRDFGPRLPLEVWRGFKQRQVVEPCSLSSRPLSSGLGLYLANQFAQSMQAQVGAISHADGATFFIDLDVSQQLSLL